LWDHASREEILLVASILSDPNVRIDGADKVSGAAVYAADVVRPGMLHARILRSPLAHARIVSIDTSRAWELQGVHAILTGRDLPDYLIGRSMRDMPILARDRVRFIGEKVAAVAADTLEIAEEALGLIEVEYEELPAVFDPVEAIQPGAPLVHEPDWVRAHKTPQQNVADYPNSVSNPIYGVSQEEAEAALANAPFAFDHTFHVPIQHQAYLEPHCCLVEFDEHDVAHIWASQKAPYLLLDYLREGLGITRDQVQIHMLPLGGDFGGKGSFMDIPLTYFLAKTARRPVRMLMTMTEEYTAANPRHSATIRVRSGFDRDGKLLVRYNQTYYNSGAYAAFKPALDATLPRVHTGGLGPYSDVPMYRVEGHMVYTNTVPCGHMRDPGAIQPLVAIEAHMDLCARAMEMDPYELRLINAPRLPRKKEIGGAGTVPKAEEVLRMAADAMGWTDPKPAGVGRGIILVDVTNSPATDYTTRLIVGRDGKIELHTPIIEQGSGMLTVFRQMAAEGLGVPLEDVTIVQTMENIEYDRGVGGSRITRVVGKMIGLSTERMVQQLAELVAGEFGHEARDVTLVEGGLRTPDGRVHTVAEVASLAPSELVDLMRYSPSTVDIVDTYEAMAAEVSVDPESGAVEIRRVVSALEVGRIINPIMHRGQIDGGAIQGLGYALMEGLVWDEEGRVTNSNLHEYKLPTFADIPPFESLMLPPEPALGITPIGEGPNCGMAAVILTAVMDATGRKLDLPIHAEKLVD
jgi:CO/xanthine dehydrogenase Mo-binding subunit